MKTIDPGHYYFLDEYSGTDSDETLSSEQPLHFMHRVGEGYPNNQGSPYDGTNYQEVMRAIINRAGYLNNQYWCVETTVIKFLARIILWLFELRAARIHRRPFLFRIKNIETKPPCRTCGHIVCKHWK